jgi:anaerobic selenocysteine-containing dehydrogenase
MTAPKVLRTMCPMNCHPTFCGMLVEVEGGQPKTVSGDKDNPDSQGFLCVRGRATSEIFGNPRRLLYPQIRDDRRTNTWRRVSWDEALDFIVCQSTEHSAVHHLGSATRRQQIIAGCQDWQP